MLLDKIKSPGVYRTSTSQIAVVLHIMQNTRPNNEFTAIGYYIDKKSKQVPGRWNVTTGAAHSGAGRAYDDHMYITSQIIEL